MAEGRTGTPTGGQIALMKDIAEALNEANDIHTAMAALLPRLTQVLGLTTAWAFRFDPTRNCFVEVGASGLPPALAENDAEALKGGWCECQSQFMSGKLNQAVNIVRCSRLRDAVGDKQGLAFHASVPLYSHGKPLGILNVAASGVQAFQQDVLDVLGLIAHQVAVSVDRAGLLSTERERAEKLQRLSVLSAELVNLPNSVKLFQAAVEFVVDQLGYEACGITQRDAEDGLSLVAASHRKATDTGDAYHYDDVDDNGSIPASERVILVDAKSYLSKRIPQTEYTVRIESRFAHAFNQVDVDILSALSWQLFAALEYGRLQQQSVASAKWAERRRLAADLHDSVSQRLFSALLLTRSASMLSDDNTAAEPGKVQDLLGRIQTLIAESQEEMRALIRALRPLEERSFTAGLQARIEALQLQTQTHIHFTHQDCEAVHLAPEVKDALLKAADEAIQNALKHAGAANVFLTIVREEQKLSLTIMDDGVGFETARVKPGLGMNTMYERMAAVGGELRLKSQVESGTTLQFRVSLSGKK